jgi:hypothetical protein
MKYIRIVVETPLDKYYGMTNEYSNEIYDEYYDILKKIENTSYLSLKVDEDGSTMFFSGTLLKNSVVTIEVLAPNPPEEVFSR